MSRRIGGENNRHRVRAVILLALPAITLAALDQLSILETARVVALFLPAALLTLIGPVVNDFFRTLPGTTPMDCASRAGTGTGLIAGKSSVIFMRSELRPR